MKTVDHRGFSPLPHSITSVKLDASLSSDLKWEVDLTQALPAISRKGAPFCTDSVKMCEKPILDPFDIMWELDFQFHQMHLAHLSSYQLAVKHFVESIWKKHQKSTLGVILYKGEIPSIPLDEFAEYLHLLAAYLPDEVPPFALFNCVGDPLLFSKEIFPHIHLGFRSGPIGAIRWEENLIPLRYDQSLGVVLPLREKGLQFDIVDRCLKELDRPCRLIAEPYITQEWDGLDELLIFPDYISAQGVRMIRGFEAAGGRITHYSLSGKRSG